MDSVYADMDKYVEVMVKEAVKQERKRIVAMLREGCEQWRYSGAAKYWGKWWADRIEGEL